MAVRSIGWQTELKVRELEGSHITDRGDHLVIRTPENRGFRWGNFLLFASAPGPGDSPRWVARFEATFPDAAYVAIGLDDPAGDLGAALVEFRAAGFSDDALIVLTAGKLNKPARRPTATVFRTLKSDLDWRRATDLELASDPSPDSRDYLERRTRAVRRACTQGHGAWFGAFGGDEMLAGLGIFGDGGGAARFQTVTTHPAHRRQGLARNLLFVAGEWARAHLAAHTLVIAADPDYFALDLYRSAGFCDHERQARLERVTPQADAAPAPPARI